MERVLIPILVFIAVLGLGSALVAAVASRRRSHTRLDTLRGALDRPVGDDTLTKVVSRIGGVAGGRHVSLTLREKLARAGYFGDNAAATYIGVKLLLLVIGLAVGIGLTLVLNLHIGIEIYLAAMVGALLFFLPNMYVGSRKRRRRAEVRRHLPDVVDLLEICVSAGMGLDTAWNSVGDEIRSVSTILGDEMALTMLEMQLGAPRTGAMRNMAERTGAQELASLVALLVQSDRFGTSISEALRTFATSMREARSQRAEEAAEKTAVKLLFPLVFCIFPVMLIVTVGPASITLWKLINNRL
jgi:tight adherence protein C